MFRFTTEVERVLREAGWFPTRCVSAAEYVNPLTEVGYRPFPLAIKILENLGGLEINPPESNSNLFFPGKIILDPVYAASSEFDRVARWQEQYDLRLFPMGEYEPMFILLCAENGRIFGAREHHFDWLGDTIESALELLILARTRPVPYLKQRQ